MSSSVIVVVVVVAGSAICPDDAFDDCDGLSVIVAIRRIVLVFGSTIFWNALTKTYFLIFVCQEKHFPGAEWRSDGLNFLSCVRILFFLRFFKIVAFSEALPSRPIKFIFDRRKKAPPAAV